MSGLRRVDGVSPNSDLIGVVGLGRLGLCIALVLERSGHTVAGVERDEARALAIAGKRLHSEEPSVVDWLRESSRLSMAPGVDELVALGCRTILIAVATPSLPDGSYDHSQIDGIAEALIGKEAGEPVELVIVSTVMPGYCDRLANRLAPAGFRVSYNPAFIALGSVIENLRSPDVFLVGSEPGPSAERVTDLWRPAWRKEPQVRHVRRIEAELAKIATNSFLTLKVAFANAVGDVALQAGADPAAVLDVIGSDSRIGLKTLGFGFGFGGPCLPRDNRALDRAARGWGGGFPLGTAADDANRSHLEFQVKEALRSGRAKSRVFEHVTYKPGADSLEESQPLALAVRLAREGVAVRIRETPSVIAELRLVYGDLFEYESRQEE